MLPSADEDIDDVIESFWQIIFSVLHSFTFYCLQIYCMILALPPFTIFY